MMEMGIEPGRLLGLAEEMATRAREEDAGRAALAVLAAHAALEATVNRLGGETTGSFNYRARFLPKWHDLCERTIGRQLEAAPDLERLHALRGAVVGYRGDPERLDRRSTSPPPEALRAVGAEEARWAVESARRVIAEFHRAAGRDAPRLGVTGVVMENWPRYADFDEQLARSGPPRHAPGRGGLRRARRAGRGALRGHG